MFRYYSKLIIKMIWKTINPTQNKRIPGSGILHVKEPHSNVI